MAKLLSPDMELFEEWSVQLGVSFDKVLKKAGVTDPSEARASRARMRKEGGAPRVRERLRQVLLDYERQRKERTEVGALMLGLVEWQELGAELADLEPPQFLKLLAAAKARVDLAKEAKRIEAPFMDIK